MKSILDILGIGPATTNTLAATTGMTRSTIGRKLRALIDDGRVIMHNKTRPPLYYATREAFGSGNRILLAAVDPYGNTNLWGVLHPLACGGFFLESTPITPKVLTGVKGDGRFSGLPYFLDDMRPQGFIGRQIARNLNRQMDSFPPDPRDWNEEQIGRYLVANGDDLPGNLKLGNTALDRIRKPPHKTRREDYPELADKAMEGEICGSSAGGEQAKFATYSREREAHVIVKFSPPGEDEPARRWKDILVTEYTASEVLHQFSIPATEVEIFELGGRFFLESLRFDRTGEYGRLPMVSMQAVDAEFSGIGSNWLKVAEALHDQGLITWQHRYDIAIYWGFGKLINNTDMHLGNISFSIGGAGFSLTPIYDMCSMGFAPRGTGEVPPFAFSEPEIDNHPEPAGASIEMIKEMAREFWNRLAASELISSGFREFIRQSGLGSGL